jgi:hypothetical protein
MSLERIKLVQRPARPGSRYETWDNSCTAVVQKRGATIAMTVKLAAPALSDMVINSS